MGKVGIEVPELAFITMVDGLNVNRLSKAVLREIECVGVGFDITTVVTDSPEGAREWAREATLRGEVVVAVADFSRRVKCWSPLLPKELRIYGSGAHPHWLSSATWVALVNPQHFGKKDPRPSALARQIFAMAQRPFNKDGLPPWHHRYKKARRERTGGILRPYASGVAL